jgi:hypothetical protein
MWLVYKIQQKREIEHEIHNENRKFFSIIYSLQYLYNSVVSAPKFPKIVKQFPEKLAFPTSA